MKFDDLRSIGHNMADSLASGIGLLAGVYEMDVFGEAIRSPEGFITVNLLTGTFEGGMASPSLARAFELYRDALPVLCEKHGVQASDFRELTARFSTDAIGRRFTVRVGDQHGHHAVDDYIGIPGRRIKVLDRLGRVRPKRRRNKQSI